MAGGATGGTLKGVSGTIVGPGRTGHCVADFDDDVEGTRGVSAVFTGTYDCGLCSKRKPSTTSILISEVSGVRLLSSPSNGGLLTSSVFRLRLVSTFMDLSARSTIERSRSSRQAGRFSDTGEVAMALRRAVADLLCSINLSPRSPSRADVAADREPRIPP